MDEFVKYVLDAPDADTRASWTVIADDVNIGRVAEFGIGDWRIRYAGIGVSFNRNARYPTRDAAAEALIEARALAPLLRRTESGLRVLDEQILWYEGQRLEEQLTGAQVETYRHKAAAQLDIRPTTYLQTLLGLIDDPRAYVHAPITINRLLAERDAVRARHARPRRRALGRAA